MVLGIFQYRITKWAARGALLHDTAYFEAHNFTFVGCHVSGVNKQPSSHNQTHHHLKLGSSLSATIYLPFNFVVANTTCHLWPSLANYHFSSNKWKSIYLRVPCFFIQQCGRWRNLMLYHTKLSYNSFWELSPAAERAAWNWRAYCLCMSLSLSSSSWNVGREAASLVLMKLKSAH